MHSFLTSEITQQLSGSSLSRWTSDIAPGCRHSDLQYGGAVSGARETIDKLTSKVWKEPPDTLLSNIQENN